MRYGLSSFPKESTTSILSLAEKHTPPTKNRNSARLALMGHSDGAMDSVYLHADTEALLEASEGATSALGLTD